MKIAVDIDEVLADFSQGLVDYHNKKNGVKLSVEKRDHKKWWQVWGDTKTQAVARVYEFIHSAEIHHVRVKRGAKEGVRGLARLGHELVSITGRPMEVYDASKAWLDEHFPGAFKMIYSTDFHLIKGRGKNKGQICAEHGVELMIDDFYEYALECLHERVPVILYTTQWNDMLPLKKGMHRAGDWREVVEIVDKINAKS